MPQWEGQQVRLKLKRASTQQNLFTMPNNFDIGTDKFIHFDPPSTTLYSTYKCDFQVPSVAGFVCIGVLPKTIEQPLSYVHHITLSDVKSLTLTWLQLNSPRYEDTSLHTKYCILHGILQWYPDDILVFYSGILMIYYGFDNTVYPVILAIINFGNFCKIRL